MANNYLVMNYCHENLYKVIGYISYSRSCIPYKFKNKAERVKLSYVTCNLYKALQQILMSFCILNSNRLLQCFQFLIRANDN